MAGWITHLRIAERLADLIGRDRLDLEKFYVGSIAPDGGVPTGEPDVYIPPKNITHLGITGSRDYAGFEQKYLSEAYDLPAFSFCLGYYFHVLTDEQWGTYIYIPELDEYFGDFPDMQSFNRAIKNNWEALDLNFVKNNGDFEPYAMLMGIKRFENRYIASFPKDAFELLLGRFAEFYSKAGDTEFTDYKYLNEEQHGLFIKNCTESIYNSCFCEKFAKKLYSVTKVCQNRE